MATPFYPTNQQARWPRCFWVTSLPFPSLVVFALAAHSSIAVFYSTLTPEQVWSDFPNFLDNCFIFPDPRFVPDLWAFKVTFLPPTRFWHLEAQPSPPSGRLVPPTSPSTLPSLSIPSQKEDHGSSITRRLATASQGNTNDHGS